MEKVLVIHTRSNDLSPLSRNVVAQLLELSLEVIILSTDYKKNCVDTIKVEGVNIKQFNLNYCKSFAEFIKSHNINQIIVYDDSFVVFYPFFTIARYYGVRTVWIQHGIYSKNSSSKSLFRFLNSEKIYRNIRYVGFLKEAYNITDIRVGRLLWKLLRMAIKDEAVLPKVFIEGFRADIALVYDYNWKQRAISEKKYLSEDVFIIENLRYDLNGVSERFIFSDIAKRVVYVDQPMVELGIVKMREFMRFARELVEWIPNDYELVVSRHPKSSMIKLKRAFPNMKIEYFQGETSLLIGHFSSIFYTAQNHIPSVLIKLGDLEIYSDESLFRACHKTDSVKELNLESFLRNSRSSEINEAVQVASESFVSVIQRLFL